MKKATLIFGSFLLLLSGAAYGVNIQGQLDHVGLAWIEGWSCDAGNPGNPITVEAFATGTNGDGTCITSPVAACRVASGTASFRREAAVAANCGGNSSRGFRLPTSLAWLRDTTNHNIYVFANIGGTRYLLSGSPFNFNSLTLYSQEPIYNIDDHLATNAQFNDPQSQADSAFLVPDHTIAYYWPNATIIPHTDPSFPAPTALSDDIGAYTGFSPPNLSLNQRQLGWTTASASNGFYVDGAIGPGNHPNAFQAYGDTLGFLYDSRAYGHPNSGIFVQHSWGGTVEPEDNPRPWRAAGIADTLRFEAYVTQPQVFPDPVTSSPGDVSFWYYVFFLNDRSKLQTPAANRRAIWISAFANQSRITAGTPDPMVPNAWIDTTPGGIGNAYANTPIAAVSNGWVTPCTGSAVYSANPPATKQWFCFDLGAAQLTNLINTLNGQIAAHDAANPGSPFGPFSTDLANYELGFSLINAEAWGPGGVNGIADVDRIALSVQGMKISNNRDPSTNYAPTGYLEPAVGGQVTGWACDRDDFARPLAIDFYATGVNTTGRSCPDLGNGPACIMGEATANLLREQAVADNCGGSAYHGFAWTLPAELQTGTHQLYAYYINYPTGANAQLIASPVSLVNLTPLTLTVNQNTYITGQAAVYSITGGAPSTAILWNSWQNGVQVENNASYGQTTDAGGNWTAAGNTWTALNTGVWIKQAVVNGVTASAYFAVSKNIAPSAPPTPSASATPMLQGLGVYNWGADYRLNSAIPAIVEGAQQAQSLGVQNISLGLSYKYTLTNPNNTSGSYDYAGPASDWGSGPINTLTDLAKSPPFQQVFQMPFKVYTLTAYAFSDKDFNVQNLAAEQQEIANLTTYLLTTYQGTGKTFIIKNWEGDNALSLINTGVYPNVSSSGMYVPPPPALTTEMINWLNARHQGVLQGRTNAGSVAGIAVHDAAEFNLVDPVKWGLGQSCMLSTVIPNVQSDYIDYSAYDTINVPATSVLAQAITTDVGLIKTFIGGRPLYAGEFGFSEGAFDDAGNRTQIAAQAFLNAGLLYAINWAIEDSPAARGFNLVRSDGSRSPQWTALNNMLALSNPASTPIVQFTNLSRPGHTTDFIAGDAWQITVTGAPNQPVTISGSANGGSFGPATEGQTDASGHYVLNGTMLATQAGSWSETWSVGSGQALPIINFVVTAGSIIPPGAQVFYDQTQQPMTNTTAFWSYGKIPEPVSTPFFMYPLTSTPQSISEPLDGVADPYSLPNGHFLPTAGSAGFTTNTRDPNTGQKNIDFVLPWYDPPPAPLWADGRHNTLRYRMNLRVPYLTNTNNAFPYGFGVFRFRDRSTNQEFWYTDEFFDIRPSQAAAGSTIGLDGWDDGSLLWIVDDVIGNHKMYTSQAPDSDSFISSAFTTWRTYDFTLSTVQFLQAVRDVNKQLATQGKPAMSEDLRNYDLIHTSLDAEIAHQVPATPPNDAVLSAEIQNWQTFSEQDAPVIAGVFEGITNGISTGWACWVGQEAPIDVRIYAYAANGTPTFLGHAIANQASEPAVISACNGASAGHRFSVDLSSVLGAVQGQRVVVYAVSGNLDWADPGQFTGQSPDPKNPAGLNAASLTLTNFSGMTDIVWGNATTACTPSPFTATVDHANYAIGQTPTYTIRGASPSEGILWSSYLNGTLVGQVNTNYSQVTDAGGNWTAVGPAWTAADIGTWTKQASICGLTTPVNFNVVGTPSLTITKTANTTTAISGDTITFSINYLNSGNDNAVNAVITDPVPVGTTLVPGSISNSGTNNSGTIQWNVGTVPPGGSGTLTFQVQVN